MIAPLNQPLRKGQLLKLLLLVVLAAAPHGLTMNPWISGYFIAIVLLRLLALSQPQALPGRLLLLLLTIGGTINVLTHYHTLLGRDAGVALLTVMLSLKLIELKTRRDVYVTVFLTYFLLITQFLFHQDLMLAVYLLVVLLSLTGILVELNRQGPAASPALPLIRASALLLQALPLALLMFLLFPRLSGPLWNLDLQGSTGVTGFSDRIRPGNISQLSQSRAVAFRVDFDNPAMPPEPAQRYWRGLVLDETDGQEWRPSSHDTFADPQPPTPETQEIFDYQVTLEPHRQPWLFALESPLTAPSGSRLTPALELLRQTSVWQRYSYRVRSSSSPIAQSLNQDERSRALQLPETVTARMRSLVNEWKASNPQPAALVAHALDYFHREPFVYTLQPPRVVDNPADQFLFETRKGFCEHFATSFTLLMRTAGVPSRVVVGYQGGEINPHGNYLIVRQSDAHAWSEVWLEDRGWFRVDPTAAVAPERIEHPIDPSLQSLGLPVRFRLLNPGILAGLLQEMNWVWDAAYIGWHRWIIDYNSARQARLLAGMGLDFLKTSGKILMIGLAAVVSLSLLAIALFYKGQVSEDPAKRVYFKFCQRLSRLGLKRRPQEGAADFAARVIKKRPDLTVSVDLITLAYHQARYGRNENKALALKQLKELVRRFRYPRNENSG